MEGMDISMSHFPNKQIFHGYIKVQIPCLHRQSLDSVPQCHPAQGESEDASWVLNVLSMDSPKIQAVLLPIILVPLNIQKPKARFSHQGRIFRLQILRRGGQHWPNLQLWIMSFTGLTQNIQSLSGKCLKHLGEYLHFSLAPVFIFSFLLSPGPWFTPLFAYLHDGMISIWASKL